MNCLGSLRSSALSTFGTDSEFPSSGTPWRRPKTGEKVSKPDGSRFSPFAKLHSRKRATQLEQAVLGFGFAGVVRIIRHCSRCLRQWAQDTGGRYAPSSHCETLVKFCCDKDGSTCSPTGSGAGAGEISSNIFDSC